MLGHNCNPSAQEADAGGSRVPGKGTKEERKKRKGEEMRGWGRGKGTEGILDLSTWELGKEGSVPGSAGVSQTLCIGKNKILQSLSFLSSKTRTVPSPSELSGDFEVSVSDNKCLLCASSLLCGWIWWMQLG